MHSNGGANGLNNVNTGEEIVQLIGIRLVHVLLQQLELAHGIVNGLGRFFVALKVVTELFNQIEKSDDVFVLGDLEELILCL